MAKPFPDKHDEKTQKRCVLTDMTNVDLSLDHPIAIKVEENSDTSPSAQDAISKELITSFPIGNFEPLQTRRPIVRSEHHGIYVQQINTGANEQNHLKRENFTSNQRHANVIRRIARIIRPSNIVYLSYRICAILKFVIINEIHHAKLDKSLSLLRDSLLKLTLRMRKISRRSSSKHVQPSLKYQARKAGKKRKWYGNRRKTRYTERCRLDRKKDRTRTTDLMAVLEFLSRIVFIKPVIKTLYKSASIKEAMCAIITLTIRRLTPALSKHRFTRKRRRGNRANTSKQTLFRVVVRKKKGYGTKTFHTKHSFASEAPKAFHIEESTSDTKVLLDRVYIDEAPQIKSTQPPTRDEYRNHEPRQVSADTPGRVSDAIGDPPGQQSVYIPPGDVRKETYRLSTYERFPVACPISRKSLAKSGFYFTGFFDRVKCFACGRTVERWEGNDDPTELRWHKPDCPFPRGIACGNVPVLELFSRLRLNTQHGQTEQQQRILNSSQQHTPARNSEIPNPVGIHQTGTGSNLFIQSGTGSRPNQPSHVGNQSAPRHPQRWRMANVISADHRRFLSNLYLNRELDRLTTFARWPMSRPNVSPTALAKSGFFYLGDMDRTQCFSCGGVLRNWTSEDNAQEEHRTHFPSCPMVHGMEFRNIPVPEEAETPEQRARLYPCRYSASPHMRSEDARLDTFQHGWQTGRTTATPAEIAQAGFFFLGERDRVKCWYCNGGLQNWEYDDVPWVEHAKWFPNCQFLLQNKGQNYVHHHLSMNPHLARPVIAKQEGATIDPMPSEVRGQDIPPSETRTVTQPSASPAIIDPREEMRKKRERIDQILGNSDLVKNVLTMGFSEEIVRGLIEERIDAGREANPNDIFGSVSELLDAVMAKEAEEMNVEENNEPSMTTEPSGVASNTPSYGSSLGPPLGSGRYNVSYIGDERMDESEPGSATSMQPQTSVRENNESLEEQLRKMEEERMCKICFTNMADMVYIPCGHMCCCMECTRAINKCPVCRKKIEKALKTYAT